MMAINILHEGEQLKVAANNMASVIRSMENIQKTMDSMYNRTMILWDGEASTQHESNYKKLQDIIKKYLEDARQTKTALDAAVVAYERTEGVQVQKVSQLDTKGIF